MFTIRSTQTSFVLCAKWNFLTIDLRCIFCDYSSRSTPGT